MIRKWKWPFVNGCECKNQIYIVIEFLNLGGQVGTDTSVCCHFEYFGCWRSCLFPLHSSMFCLRSEMVHSCPIACHCGFCEHISFFFEWLHMWKSSLKMLIFVLFHQTSCGISVLHTQCYVHLWWTTTAQWIHLCDLVVSKISSSTLTSPGCAEPTNAIIIMGVHIIL